MTENRRVKASSNNRLAKLITSTPAIILKETPVLWLRPEAISISRSVVTRHYPFHPSSRRFSLQEPHTQSRALPYGTARGAPVSFPVWSQSDLQLHENSRSACLRVSA